MVDVCLACTATGVVVAIGADDDVVVAVTVDVAGCGHASDTEVVACSFALYVPVGNGILGETRGGAVVYIGLAGCASSIVI